MTIHETMQTPVRDQCDIAAFAQAPTENFRQGNVLAAWYYGVDEQ